MQIAPVSDEGDVGPVEVGEHAHKDLPHETLAVGEPGE